MVFLIKKHLAKEIQDVLRGALQVASYYEVEDLLTATIQEDFEQIKKGRGDFLIFLHGDTDTRVFKNSGGRRK